MDNSGNRLYPGSTVTVKWKGGWYDGVVSKVGPQNHLLKVLDVASGQEILIESNQLKLLDGKIIDSKEKRFAFNDGDSWLEVKLLDSNANGAARVCWRKNVHSLENETWFEKSNIAPVDEAYKLNLPKDELHASKSGLLPVKGIEEHSRTINNVLYQSDTESEEYEHDYTDNMASHRDPAVIQGNRYAPMYTNDSSMLQPPTDNFTQNRHNDFPAMPPPMPPKRIAQSSMPCVWSYTSECFNGIAPHHSSNFFHRLRQREHVLTGYSSNHSQHSAPHPSNFTSQSQNQITKGHGKKQQQSHRHSLYNQFMLRKDTRLQEPAAAKTSRRAQLTQQRLPPTVASGSPGVVTVKVGENALLACTATGTQPIKYEWLKDENKMPLRAEYPGPGLLRLNKVSSNDEAVYSCNVSNKYGSAIHYFSLIIQLDDKRSKKTSKSHANDTSINGKPTVNNEVMEYLDAIMDEFRILESDSQYDLQGSIEHTTNAGIPSPDDSLRVPQSKPSTSTPVPRISVTKALNQDEFDQYLLGYGENYGAQSGELPQSGMPEGRNNPTGNNWDDMNSVDVHTSLGSSQSDLDQHSDSNKATHRELPMEIESIYDQVQRFHLSMESNENPPSSKAKKNKWFNGIFSKK